MKFLYCSISIAKLRRSLTFCFHPRFKRNFIHLIAYTFTIYGFIIDPHNDQLPVDLIAQLVEHCTGIAGVWVHVLLRPEFFRPFVRFRLSSIAKLRRSLTFIVVFVLFCFVLFFGLWPLWSFPWNQTSNQWAFLRVSLKCLAKWYLYLEAKSIFSLAMRADLGLDHNDKYFLDFLRLSIAIWPHETYSSIETVCAKWRILAYITIILNMDMVMPKRWVTFSVGGTSNS